MTTSTTTTTTTTARDWSVVTIFGDKRHYRTLYGAKMAAATRRMSRVERRFYK